MLAKHFITNTKYSSEEDNKLHHRKRVWGQLTFFMLMFGLGSRGEQVIRERVHLFSVL